MIKLALLLIPVGENMFKAAMEILDFISFVYVKHVIVCFYKEPFNPLRSCPIHHTTFLSVLRSCSNEGKCFILISIFYFLTSNNITEMPV